MKCHKCIYHFVGQCKHASDSSVILEKVSSKSLQTSREKSVVREDSLFQILSENNISDFYGHEYCRKQYNSKDHTNRYVKKRKRKSQNNEDPSPIPRKTVCLRSCAENFDLKTMCFYRGFICHVENPDPKHPDRWDKGFLCRTVDRGKGKKSYLWVVLQVQTTFIYIIIILGMNIYHLSNINSCLLSIQYFIPKRFNIAF